MILQFVLLFPFIFWVTKRYGLLGLFSLIAINVLYELACGGVGDLAGVYRLILLRHLGVVSIGAYMFEVDLLQKRPMAVLVSFLLIAIGGAYIWAVNYGGYEPFVFTRWVNNSFPAALFTVGIVMFLRTVKPVKCLKWVGVMLGGITYEIFLVQKLFYAGPAAFVYAFPIPMFCKLLLCCATCVAGGRLFALIVCKVTAKLKI